MQSIQTCMESQGNAINGNLVSINNAIIGCASSLSDAASIISNATTEVKDATVNSVKDLNKSIDKMSDTIKDSMSQSTASTVGLGGSVGAGLSNVGASIINLTKVTASIRSALKLSNLELIKIASNTKKLAKKGIKGKESGGSLMRKLFESKEEKAAKKVKIPEVKGGKNVGEIVSAMADAAVKMDKISLAKSLLLQVKIGGIFDAFFNTVNKHEKSMTPAKMKKYEVGVKSMEKISRDIFDLSESLAGVAMFALPAKLGAKAAKKIIKGTLDAIKPLENAKNIAKTLIAVQTLDKIATSLLKFTARMALVAVVAPVAMVGMLLSALVIREARWALKPLSKMTATKKYVTAALNLELIGKSMLWFNAAMALNSILAVPALVGMGLTAIVLKGANMLFKNIGNKKNSIDIRSGVYNILLISTSIITFTLTILATTMITRYIITGGTDKIDWTNIASIAASVGVFALMYGSYKFFGKLGDKRSSDKVRRGAVSTLLMSAAILSFSVALFVTHILTKQIVQNWKGGADPWAIVGDVAVFGLMLGSYYLFRRIGKEDNVRKVMGAGMSILVMSLGLVAFSGALWITHQIMKNIVGNWKSGVDVKAAVMDLAVFGLMLGSLWVYKRIGTQENVRKAFAGFGAIAAMSLGLVIFSAALWISNAIVGTMWKTKDGKMDWMGLIKTVAVFGLLYGSMWIFKKGGENDNMKKILKGAGAVVGMSAALAIFGFALIPPLKTVEGASAKSLIGMPLLLASLLFIFNKAGKGDNPKNILKGSGAVAGMAVALGLFGFGLGFYTKAIDGVKTGTLIMMPVLLGIFVLEFVIAGKFTMDILKGTVVIAAMAVGLGIFGFGVKFYVDAIKDIGWKQVGMMAALIGIFGVEFALLGIPAVAMFVALGSAAVAAMGVGLISFGFGVGKYATEIDKVGSWKKVGMMAALIGIFGAEFALLGPLAPAIVMADVAFAVMGAALIPFGYGVGKFVEPIQKMNWKDIGKMAGIIGIFGLEFSLLAPLAIPIGIGAVAIFTIAGALKRLGLALQEWSKANIDKNQLDLICISIDRLKLAFMGKPKGDDSGGGVKGFFKKIGSAISGAITGAFELAPITTSATAIAIISGALSSLGRALQNWNGVNIDEKKLDILCLSIDRIKLAFQGTPKGDETETKGFLKRFAGKMTSSMFAPFNLAQMQVTASAMTTAGITIKRLAKGMQEWTNSDIDITKITEISTVLIAVRDIFSILGGNNKGKEDVEKGWFGRTMAAYTPSDAAKGAVEARKMGTALKEIAKGLTEFYDTYGTKFKSTTYMKEFTDAVVETVTSVSSAFKMIGDAWLGKEIEKLETESGRKYSDLFKFFVGGKNAVQEGIKSVKGIGNALKDIASGMKEFKDLVNSKDNTWITDVANGVATLLTGIQEPLIKFGTVDESIDVKLGQAKTRASKIGAGMVAVHEASEQTVNYNTHKTDVARALESVGNIGKMMEGMAAIVKALSDKKIIENIGEPGKINKDWGVDGGSGMVRNMQMLTCGAISVFWQLGESLKNGGVLYDIETKSESKAEVKLWGAGVSTSSSTKKTPSKTYFGMAVDAATGIGDIISGIAEGFEALGKIAKPDKIIDVTAKLVQSIALSLTAFAQIGASVTSDGTQKSFDLIPAELGYPEATAKFGKVGQLRRLLYWPNSDEPQWDKVMEGVKKAAKGVSESVKSLAAEQSSLNYIAKNPTNVFEPVVNIMTMATTFVERENDTKYTFYSKSKPIEYTLKSFKTSDLDKSKGIADKYASVLTKVKNMSDTAANIKSANGRNFTDFTNQLVTGMNKLAGAGNNIDKSQKFVDSLRNAVKEKVFDNISSNTQKIANAINSINNDIMKPYADMIAGFGELVSADNAKTTKALEDIKKTIEEIVETINSNGNGGGSGGTGGNGSGKTGGNGSGKTGLFGKQNTPTPTPQPQRPQTVKAELDANAFQKAVNEFAEAIRNLKLKS